MEERPIPTPETESRASRAGLPPPVFDYAEWREAQRTKGRQLIQMGERYVAAVVGWARVETAAEWAEIEDEAAQGWESGVTVLEMLGGRRYLEPAKAALVLTLWRDFLHTYRPSGPAEYMAMAMAVISFDHWLRVNDIVRNLESRLETEFFSLDPLHTDQDTRTFPAKIRGLSAEALLDKLGQDALPLLDRLNRLVLRNLRMLRELKGGALSLTVANYGQVNVGQQQSNHAETGAQPG